MSTSSSFRSRSRARRKSAELGCGWGPVGPAGDRLATAPVERPSCAPPVGPAAKGATRPYALSRLDERRRSAAARSNGQQ